MKLSMQFVIVILTCFSTAALTSQSITLKGGLNVSSIKHSIEEFNDFSSARPGFHIGALAELPLNKFLSVESGLLLNTKGFIAESEFVEMQEQVSLKSKWNTAYVDIPITFKGSIDAGNTRIFALAGPYVGIGFAGNMRYGVKDETTSTIFESQIEWGPETDLNAVRRLDMGLMLGTGVEINAIHLSINYGLGLNSIVASNEGEISIRNRVLMLSLGYVING